MGSLAGWIPPRPVSPRPASRRARRPAQLLGETASYKGFGSSNRRSPCPARHDHAQLLGKVLLHGYEGGRGVRPGQHPELDGRRPREPLAQVRQRASVAADHRRPDALRGNDRDASVSRARRQPDDDQPFVLVPGQRERDRPVVVRPLAARARATIDFGEGPPPFFAAPLPDPREPPPGIPPVTPGAVDGRQQLAPAAHLDRPSPRRPRRRRSRALGKPAGAPRPGPALAGAHLRRGLGAVALNCDIDTLTRYLQILAIADHGSGGYINGNVAANPELTPLWTFPAHGQAWGPYPVVGDYLLAVAAKLDGFRGIIRALWLLFGESLRTRHVRAHLPPHASTRRRGRRRLRPRPDHVGGVLGGP